MDTPLKACYRGRAADVKDNASRLNCWRAMAQSRLDLRNKRANDAQDHAVAKYRRGVDQGQNHAQGQVDQSS